MHTNYYFDKNKSKMNRNRKVLISSKRLQDVENIDIHNSSKTSGLLGLNKIQWINIRKN